MILGVDQAVML